MKACWCTMGNTGACKTCPNRVEYDGTITYPYPWFENTFDWEKVITTDVTADFDWNVTIYQQGWMCPECNTIYSPDVTECDCQKKPKTTCITNCVRCGNDHEHLEMHEFINHEKSDFDYWTMCPELDEPIMIKITKEEEME